MMLSFQWHAESGTPVLFLHGLLGSQQDWLEVLSILQKFPKIRPLTLDLPFHGLSKNISCADFTVLRTHLHTTLKTVIGTQSFYLVGYSLGGRIALDYLLNVNIPNLKGIVLEGVNIGLTSETERQNRLKNDLNWANRFRKEPIETVLKDWYRQPVFADLTNQQRVDYIESRKHNLGIHIAQMLEASSLAKQPHYAKQLRQAKKNVIFFVGENDYKFRQMAKENQLPTQIIQAAGHNTHRENSVDFVNKLIEFINI